MVNMGAEEPNVGPYADEPVADEEWLSKYRERKQSHGERLRILQNKLQIYISILTFLLCLVDTGLLLLKS